MKRILAIIFTVCIAVGLMGCASGYEATLEEAAEDINRNAPIMDLEGCTEIAQSESLRMKYDAVNNSVMVYEKSSDQTLCTSAVDEAYYGQEIKNNLTRNAIRQLITIAYTDYNNVSAVATDTDGNCEKKIRRIDNGLRLDFHFQKPNIQLSMELTVVDDQLRVHIPAASLKENGDFGLTRIDVLPMLGAVNTLEEGYFFFPDGCGALYQFGEYMGAQKTISMDVYDTMNIEMTDGDSIEPNASNVCLPVFGISLMEKGIFANIVAGEMDCSINLASAEGAYALNRIYPSIRVRKQYPLQTASGEEAYAYQKNAYMSDFEIVYEFLEGDTSYSAMANVYREYLIENNILTQQESDSLLALDFIMGVNKEEMLGGKDVLLTTLDDIDTILEDLDPAKSTTIKSVLYGWQKGGYGTYPTGDSFLNGTGTEDELSDLCGKYEVYLLSNYINANSGNSGFSKQSDVVYSLGGSPLTDRDENRYLLNPTTQLKRVRDDLEIITEAGAGAAFEGVGKTIYEDFDSKRRLTRYGYVQTVKSYLADAGKETKVCTDGFMKYFAEYSNYVINLPDDTSNSFFWCKEVPFLQMVLHGNVDYSASLPGNLSSDFLKTKLKWIEYGYMPTFMLSGGRNSLLGTDYDLLFSSDYKHWKDTITSVLTEFDARLSCIKNEHIVLHESENQVATVQYANGVTIIINYNAWPEEIKGITIPAQDYVVIESWEG